MEIQTEGFHVVKQLHFRVGLGTADADLDVTEVGHQM